MHRVISDTNVPIKIWATDLEEEAEKQVRNVAGLPFIFKHVAVMADAHAGRGSTVGTVIATKGAIIPAACGVDIGCGCASLRLPFKVDDLKELGKLRQSIERSVPVGRNNNHQLTERTEAAFLALGDVSDTAKTHIKKLNKTLEASAKAIGSLGGNNHFFELCYDQNNDIWILLHCGSRNIGKVLAEVHIDRAKNLMKEYFISLADPELAYLAQGTHEFKEYLHDLMWGQRFAEANREEIMDRGLRDVLYHLGCFDKYDEIKLSAFRINVGHNYTALENHFGSNVYITRKGATSAKDGQWCIIPGSRSTGSWICKGKGNLESFQSCSHGCGRSMSRTKARQMFTQEDLAKTLVGIEASSAHQFIEEIQYAYKDIVTVMANQTDLVDPIFNLKVLLNVKG